MNILLAILRGIIATGLLLAIGAIFLAVIVDFFDQKPPSGGVGAV